MTRLTCTVSEASSWELREEVERSAETPLGRACAAELARRAEAEERLSRLVRAVQAELRERELSERELNSLMGV